MPDLAKLVDQVQTALQDRTKLQAATGDAKVQVSPFVFDSIMS